MTKLCLETFQVTEDIIVNDGNKTIEFQDGVLERGCCKQNLFPVRESKLDGVCRLVGGLIDIAEAVSLVNNGQIPLRMTDVRSFSLGELVRTDDYFIGVKRV